MARFRIEGGHPLRGRVRPAGNKNAALPMLAACLLTTEPVILDNVPDILDVRIMLELLAALGVEITRRGRRVTCRAAHLASAGLDPNLSRRLRGSILLIGPLAARCGQAVFHLPGGDNIGRRRLDTHFLALRALGFELRGKGPYTLVRRPAPRRRTLLLDEASVTATEQALLTAARRPGPTTIYNAACEPHVVDLAGLLTRMGARVTGAGTNRLTVRGLARPHGARARVSADLTEIGSFLAAAALTGGALEVAPLTRAEQADLEILRGPFGRLGLAWRACPRGIKLAATRPLAVQGDWAGAIPCIADGPWPNFPSDLLSILIVAATQTRGEVLFFEKMFESRLYFMDHLIQMGARIVPCDPHRVLVSGPAPLRGQHLASPDIRAGMALILAALAARGETIIDQAEVIDRGYEQLEIRLRALGAAITRLPSP
ncbi:MAG: UDP-N-acetylglucosamine 1-carboxyvinyltransferase [Candidatus Marinimicrobia bacterium]|nr:UDP-N-acetylglucosamine 1-carboxyvinyltransferase [Candidatus Neomarinimicrobiota bacterium]